MTLDVTRRPADDGPGGHGAGGGNPQNPSVATVPAGAGVAGAGPADAGLAGTRSAWMLVTRREIMVKATDRSFLMSTVITIAIMAALVGLQVFLGTRTHSYTVVAQPTASAMAGALERGARGVDDKVRVTARTVPDEAAARAALLEGTAQAWLHPADGGWVLTTKSQSQDPLRTVTAEIVRREALSTNASALGTTAAALERGASLRTAYLQGDADRAMFVTIVGLVFATLFYMASLVFGMALASSVIEEKQSRIVEIIATAIPVRHLLAGKVLGNTVLAVLQLILYVAVGLIGLAFTTYSPLITAVSAPALWFVVFFLAGFVALACLWAVAGSLASRAEDVQSTAMPLTMLTMAVFFGGISLEGTWQAVASYVPLLSAVVMPIRLLQGDASWWQALIALVLLLGTAALTVVLGERLYRRSLLQTGGRLSWRQAWRAAE